MKPYGQLQIIGDKVTRVNAACMAWRVRELKVGEARTWRREVESTDSKSLQLDQRGKQTAGTHGLGHQ